MLKLTLKEIKNYNCEDITAKSEKIDGLEVVGLSYGVYGMNGGLFKDKDGNFYKITSRCSNLFRYA